MCVWVHGQLRNMIIRAFTAYVQPIQLCYMVTAYKTGHWKGIEKVQGRFTKRLSGFANRSYGKRLHKLEMCILELRWLCFDMYTCYRIIFGQMNVCMQNFFELSMHLGLEAVLINYTDVIVLAVFELHTLLIVLWMCRMLFHQIILTFNLLLHLNRWFSRLTSTFLLCY